MPLEVVIIAVNNRKKIPYLKKLVCLSDEKKMAPNTMNAMK